VWEDEAHLAFLAAQPVHAGHTILTTKRIAPYVFELSPAEQSALWAAAAEVAALLKRNLPCERVCIAVVGWEVRHVHVHLVPTDKPGEFPPLGGAQASADELEWIAQRIRTGRAPAC
jgi:histidine triad (HIT) family protein